MVKRFVVTLLWLVALSGAAWADPALWAVRGPHATVYLLGSVHMLRPDQAWEGPAIRRALDEAAECWFEVDPDRDPAEVQAAVARIAYDADHRLSDLMTAAQRAELDGKAAGWLTRLDPMRPWFAAMVLGTEPLARAGYDAAFGVEAVLAAQARAAGKALHGIETAEDQVRLLSDMPDDAALQLVVASLREADAAPGLMDQVVARWQGGGADDATAAMREASPDLHRRVFAERNARFAAVVARLAAGERTALVVVGAGHLSGPDSVRAVLGSWGLGVERVE